MLELAGATEAGFIPSAGFGVPGVPWEWRPGMVGGGAVLTRGRTCPGG